MCVGNITSRDLSALRFHARVLEEAAQPIPVMEKARFISIAYAGLEEFQRVRLPRLKREEKTQALSNIESIYARAEELFSAVMDELGRLGLSLDGDAPCPELQEIPAEELPGSALLLAARLPEGDVRFFSLDKQDRLLPAENHGFARLERAAAAFLQENCGAEKLCFFRILRDESAAPEEGSEAAVAACMAQRRQGDVQRLETWGSRRVAEGLRSLLQVKKKRCHALTGFVHPGGLMKAAADLPGWEEHHFPPFEPRMPRWAQGDILQAVREKDRLLIHPYDSFDPVIRMLQAAAEDPLAEEVKITLYRVKHGGRLTQALCDAARAGKRVTVLVEKRARFEEERNLSLAEELQSAGCRVISGPAGYKVHSKILMLVRREGANTRRYLHLGTGNYHESTARQYTDVSIFTADEPLGRDAEQFFASLEDGTEPQLEAMSASPWGLRQELVRLIRREMSFAARGEACGVNLKMNALTDPVLISLLEEAAAAGVPVDITVRGACGLRPGEDGTGRIRVRSIVGRFLEHARIFRFTAGGRGETYIASADWMKRNLLKRVELLIPVKDHQASSAVKDYLLSQQQDTAKAWELYVDDYTAARCCAKTLIDSQAERLHEYTCNTMNEVNDTEV